MKKQSFIAGAILLMAANALSKILGAVLKIPLAYILKEEGMAVYNIAFEAYIMFLAFVISGLPFAVSKLSAEASSRGEKQRERKIVTVSTWLLVIVGAAGSIILYFAAPYLAIAMKEEKAVLAIQVIAPSVFLVALGTGYKSYFQGVSKMVPVALSQVAESLIKLVAGYALAVMFIKFGTETAAGGAISGVTAGEAVATAILMFGYIFRKKEEYISSEKITSRAVLRDIMTLAVPLLCASVVSNAIGIADTTLTRSRLLDAGLNQDRARFLYGAYTGYALTVFHLPVGILATLGISILPVIAGAYATGNRERAEKATDMGLRISVILSVPCSVAMYAMSGDILNILFHNENAAMMLEVVAPCAVLMCAVQMSAAILQSAGKIMTPFFNSLAGMAVKITLDYFLIGNAEINIYGSAIASIAANILILLLNFMSVRYKLKLRINIVSILVKTFICGGVMYGVIYLVKPYFTQYNSYIALAGIAVLSGLAYFLMLFLTRAVTIKEIKQFTGR